MPSAAALRLRDIEALGRCSVPTQGTTQRSVTLQPFRGYGNRHSFGQRVEHRRVCRSQLAKLLQLRVGHIGFDFEIYPDALISVAHVLVEVKKSAQIEIAFQRRL